MMREFFTAHPNVKGVIVLNSGNVVANFLEQNNINDIKLVGVDLTNPILLR